MKNTITEPAESVKGKMDDPDVELVEIKRVLMGTCVLIIYLASLLIFLFNSVAPTTNLRITFLVLLNIANLLAYRIGWVAILFEKLLRWNPLDGRNELYTTKDVGGYFMDLLFIFAAHSILLVFPIVMILNNIITVEVVICVSIIVASAFVQIWYYLPLFKRFIKA